jgi:hypothetical protein
MSHCIPSATIIKKRKNRLKKECLMSLAIKVMQIKMTLRFHLTPVKMAIIKKTVNRQMLARTRGKKPFTHCWWRCAATVEISMEAPQKLNLELPYDPIIEFLGI